MNKYILLIILLLPSSVLANNQLVNNKITNLITPVSYFVDHIQQLKKIQDNLNKFKQTSIIGTSGIGKTQLARTYAYENKNKYEIIWFVDCNLDINQEFLKLAQELNLKKQANMPKNGKAVKAAVLEYLKGKDNWLLVFDNLKVGKNKKVKDVIEWEHNGHVIFTSQDRQRLPHTIELTNFKKNDCIILANNILEKSSEEQANFLATSLKGYPILVVQTAQLLNQIKGLDFEVYKKQAMQSEDKIRLNVSLAINNLPQTAVDLLYQIALINNQSFSKEFLSYVTNNRTSLDDDIYQISKFVLISNIDSNEHNSIFEMHDIIAQTIITIIGKKKTREILNRTLDNLLLATPDTITEFHIFRDGKTVFENFRIFAEHTDKYNIDILKSMVLKSYLMIQYNNYSDYSGAAKLVSWFNQNDAKGIFKLSIMNNDERARYADFLGSIARYYRNRYSDFDKSMKYNKKAETVYENVKGYKELKADVYYQLALNELKVGNVDNVAQYIVKLRDTPFVNNIEAMLFYLKGQYKEALEKMDASIKIRLKKIKSKDLVLTSNYLLRAQILNFLDKYQEAYQQTTKLADMHISTKKSTHLIFGRIYTQMARSELGLGKTLQADDHIKKAIEIFQEDKAKHSKKEDYPENTYLADAYVVQGNIFFTQDNLQEALKSYRLAQKIYFYLYKDNSGNINQISYFYTQGAKAACKAKDLYHYKCFGKPQIQEFGVDHPNSTMMFEYCKKYGMDLWAEES